MSKRMTPFLSLRQIEPEKPFSLGKYTITPIPVVHSVPTVGYLIDDGTTAFGLFTDTQPIPEALTALAGHPRLKAVFLECSFPRRLQKLADISGHLTTDDFRELARLLPGQVAIYPIHIKPRFHNEIVAELGGFHLPNLRIAEPGQIIEI
jgi:ribonuclease BN (tRNA processing enzyme)